MNDLDPTSDLLATRLASRAGGVSLPSGSLATVRRRAVQRHQRTRIAIGVGGIAVAGGLVALVLADNDPAGDHLAPIGSTETAPEETSQRPPITAGPTTHLTAPLQRGSKGAEVAALQTRLKELGFDPGPADGTFGPGTEMAVWAFEGLANGTPYAMQSGVVTDDLWQQIQSVGAFEPRRSEPDDTHMEIYLPLQAAILFTNDKPTLITHISSGSGEEWCEVFTQDTDDLGIKIDPPILKDECGVSRTPGGIFLFYRRYPGERLTSLGGMWKPVYFNYGIAVHGADQVPRQPASHGAVRIPQWIADYFPEIVGKGDRVYVWGMDGKSPEDYSRDEMLPVFNYPNTHSTLTLEPTTTG
ncbi:MAG: L,D-transpeptidase family protein [Actinomycetota bacterium]|nr:L,D-transpeptidase family protein [Actinomycetota bacterium]